MSTKGIAVGKKYQLVKKENTTEKIKDFLFDSKNIGKAYTKKEIAKKIQVSPSSVSTYLPSLLGESITKRKYTYVIKCDMDNRIFVQKIPQKNIETITPEEWIAKATCSDADIDELACRQVCTSTTATEYSAVFYKIKRGMRTLVISKLTSRYSTYIKDLIDCPDGIYIILSNTPSDTLQKRKEELMEFYETIVKQSKHYSMPIIHK